MAIKYLSFDAFGTVFNIEGIRKQMYEFVGARDLELYQRFQLRLAPYNWYANSVQQYAAGQKYSADIYLVGASAILQAAGELGIDLNEKQAAEIALGLGKLPMFPGMKEALVELHRDYPLAILSNGTPECLKSLVETAGVEKEFDYVLSVKSAGFFKPDPKVYELAPKAFKAPTEEVALVSSNDWDTSAAHMAGLHGIWLARKRRVAPVFGIKPDIVVNEMGDLPGKLRALSSAAK
jgi:2-haloacid dehalogenase